MIRYVRGDLFDSKAQTLVNPVNCRGVMGKGLAKLFKDRWPLMFRQYQEACKKREVRPGSPLLFKDEDRQILSVPTKDDWKKPSTLEMVEAGLKAIREGYRVGRSPQLRCRLWAVDWAGWNGARFDR